MRKMRWPIYLFTVFLLICIACLAFTESDLQDGPGLSVIVSSDGQQEEIFCQKLSVNGNYCIFLPGYAEMSEAVLCKNEYQSIILNGRSLSLQTKMTDFQLNVPYAFTCQKRDELYSGTLMFVQSANIATMYINTASGNMEYIHEGRENKESGIISLYDVSGKLNHSGDLKYIKGRGNSTWDYPKKPYNIRLHQEADLLGMGAARTWVLLAEYTDASCSKNKLIYDFAKKAGLPYSPDCDWVDLYLNGEYAGIYLLSEHVEVHQERVNIKEEGSFLVTLDGEYRLQERGYVYTAPKDTLALRIRHADMPVEEVERIWTSARNAILAEDGVDPVTGRSWDELIDMDSWALRYLLDEVFANYDGGFISQNFYYTAQEDAAKIYAGPVWDMDLTIGNFGGNWPWQTGTPYCLHAGRPHLFVEDDTPLFYTLCRKTAFFDRVLELYQSVFLPELTKLMHEEMEQYPVQLMQALKINRLRWWGASFSEYLNYSDSDYLDYLKYSQEYLKERISFLNDLWLNEGEYCFVLMKPYEYNVWGNHAVKLGECLPQVPEEPGFGWYYFDTGLPFDVTQPIYEDVMIYMAPLDSDQADDE